jgi:hypothetical protein
VIISKTACRYLDSTQPMPPRIAGYCVSKLMSSSQTDSRSNILTNGPGQSCDTFNAWTVVC